MYFKRVNPVVGKSGCRVNLKLLFVVLEVFFFSFCHYPYPLSLQELKGDTWVYSSYVMCFINDQFLGNAFDLKKWAQKVWDVVDVRPSALYEALTLNYATKFLKDTKASYTEF